MTPDKAKKVLNAILYHVAQTRPIASTDEAIAIMREEAKPISDAEILDIAGNWDCGTNGENIEWLFKSPKELIDFARALLERTK